MTTRGGFSRWAWACALVTVLAGATSVQARTAAPATAHTRAANSQTYVDELGDAKSGGFDIQEVKVSNDETGRIRFSIEIPSQPRLPPRRLLIIRLDVDRNPQTGSAGDEYAIELHSGSLLDVTLLKFGLCPGCGTSSRDWYRAPGPGLTAHGLTVEIDRSALGNPSSFDFKVATFSDAAGSLDDRAPSAGGWRYDVIAKSKPQSLARVVREWNASGDSRWKATTAGEPFAYAAAFRVRSTGKWLVEGRAACVAEFQRRVGDYAYARMIPRSVAFARLDGKPAFICKFREISRARHGSFVRVTLSVKNAAGTVVAISEHFGRVY